MMTKTLKPNEFNHTSQYIRTILPLHTETAIHRCTVIITTHPSEYTIFLKALQKHDVLDKKYSMIEMHHTKRRMSYVKPLNLLVVQMEIIERLQYLNITPDKVLLTGTARCFDVKQAPCDTIVTADAVWDKEQDILYECSSITNNPILRTSAIRCRTGGYFSETSLQMILEMQKEKNEKHTFLAYDEDSVTFARICHAFQWEWTIIKAVTNDISIPNNRMRDHAAELAANYIIEAILNYNSISL